MYVGQQLSPSFDPRLADTSGYDIGRYSHKIRYPRRCQRILSIVSSRHIEYDLLVEFSRYLELDPQYLRFPYIAYIPAHEVRIPDQRHSIHLISVSCHLLPVTVVDIGDGDSGLAE